MNEEPASDVLELSDQKWLDAHGKDVRQFYIKHEASVKFLGVYYFWAIAITIIIGTSEVFLVEDRDTAVRGVLALLYILLGMFQFRVGKGLQDLRTWAQLSMGGSFLPGLFAFPLGTIICGYFLFLLFSKKGRMVFSKEYKHVIRATPEIEYKMSSAVHTFMALAILIISLGLLATVI